MKVLKSFNDSNATKPDNDCVSIFPLSLSFLCHILHRFLIYLFIAYIVSLNVIIVVKSLCQIISHYFKSRAVFLTKANSFCTSAIRWKNLNKHLLRSIAYVHRKQYNNTYICWIVKVWSEWIMK